MQSNSAPEVGGSHPTVASSHPEPPDDDPVRRLLGGPPDPVRQLGLRHWLGIAGLVAAIAAAAFALPPLITSSDRPPAPRPVAAPLPSSDPSPAAVNESPSVPPPTASATVPTGAPATGGSSAAPDARSSAGAAPPTRAQPQPQKSKSGAIPAGDPGVAPFQPVTRQAEAGTLSDGAGVVECATCRAGARVRWLGRVDVHATVPWAGMYQITVVYETNGSRSLNVSINGNPPVATLAVTGTNWTTPRSVTLNAHLPVGSVDIGLSAGNGSPPDVDAVTIS